MLEGTSPSAPVAPSSSRKTSASGDLTAGPATEMPSPSTTSACGQGFSGKLQTESCFQQSPLQSGNVYVQASPVLSATNVYVQGQAPFANYQACAHAAQPGHIDAAAAVPASDAGMPGSTSGSCALFPCLLWEKNCCRIVRASYVRFQSLRDRSPSGSSLWRSMVSKSPAVANVASTLDMSSEEIRSLDKSGTVL